VHGLLGTREDRTRFARPIAYGHDVVEVLIEELGDGLRAGGADVNADLEEGLDRHRIDVVLGPHPGAVDLEFFAALAPQDRLGHLAPGRVAAANEDDPDRRRPPALGH